MLSHRAAPMNCQAVLKELAALGTAQTRKTYARHGVAPPLFGVSYKQLGLLTKKLKTNHALAGELWDSGNHDARILATMIADPDKVSAKQAERWVKDLGNYVLSDAFSKLVSKSPVARLKAEKWIAARKEWVATAGWSLVAHLAMSNRDTNFSDDQFAAFLPRIEQHIHAAPNRALRDEHGADYHRRAQRETAQQGARCRPAHRQGRGRSWPDQLQDPRRRQVHRQDARISSPAHRCEVVAAGDAPPPEFSCQPGRRALD